MKRKRVRSEAVCLWLRPDELALIRERMAEAGIRNMSAYLRKMALNGYVLNVDLAPVRELVSLQRRCANSLNQVAIRPTHTAEFTRRRSPGSKKTMKPCGGRCPTCSKSWPPL